MIENNYKKYLLTAILACSFPQIVSNRYNLLPEKEINMQSNDLNDKSNKLQQAQEMIKSFEENSKEMKEHTLSLSIMPKLQIIKIENNTKNTFNYHIAGTISDINEKTGKLEYILVDMINLKPLYKLDENKNVIGEVDEISYSEKGILSDYLIQLGYIKKRYKSTELDQIITFINDYEKNEQSILKK